MLENLLGIVQSYNSKANIELIQLAFEVANESHKGQVRNSGEPYIVHPVAVATILAKLQMDDETICAGLMHDVLEDTEFSKKQMLEIFGEEITNLVDGVTKLKKIKYKSKKENQIENIRKMVLAMANDIRVIIIKLSDRLHNMRTLKYKNREKQIATANETLEIYVPIAHRLGINTIKWELEDLCLRYKDPVSYYNVADQIAQKRSEREHIIDQIITKLSTEVEKFGIDFKISGRPKSIFSIYNKIKKQNSSIDNIFDLIAVRVLVENISECYAVLGIAHNIWKPIPGRFKDYIAMPKPNLYQSLHTTVIGERGQIFEVQIRTYEMHRIAEYGIAAHWKYKEGKSKISNLDQRLTWIRQLIEWGKEADNQEFMENFKGDLFSDEVYVFSPKGDVVDLPNGSCPIDFAYKVHTEVGNKCVGAKVNGKIVPLNYKVKTGDIIEIMTSSNSTGPSSDWIDIVVSTQAKNKIKQYFRKSKKEENIEYGRILLEKEIKKKGYDFSKILVDEWLEDLAKWSNLLTIPDLYAGIGYGSVNLKTIVQKLESRYEKENEEKKSFLEYQDNLDISTKENAQDDVSIGEVSNLDSKFAKCCNPVPGDKIVGYITMGRGITIHRSNCTNILSLENKERLIEVRWDENMQKSYPVKINVVSTDRQGYLADITKVLSKEGFNISAVNAKINKDGTFTSSVLINIDNSNQLDKVFAKLKKVKGTLDVYRIKT